MRCIPFLLSFCLLLLLSGCASVSVKNVKKSRTGGDEKPECIYITPFDTESGVWRVDREDAQLQQFKQQLNDVLTAAIAERISRNITRAVVLKPGEKPGKDGWLLTGKFVRVNQGSRALRMVVGLGAGGTKLETQITIRDLSSEGTPVVLSTMTTGGSNAEPGAIINTDPLSAAATLVMSSGRGLSEDAVRTARMIVALISQYGADRGWIDPARAMAPKHAGRFTSAVPTEPARRSSKEGPR